MKEFRFIGPHAETLENGRPVGTGEYTGPINEKAPKNAQLIKDGLLIELPEGAANAIENAQDDEDRSLAVLGSPIEEERSNNAESDEDPDNPEDDSDDDKENVV